MKTPSEISTLISTNQSLFTTAYVKKGVKTLLLHNTSLLLPPANSWTEIMQWLSLHQFILKMGSWYSTDGEVSNPAVITASRKQTFLQSHISNFAYAQWVSAQIGCIQSSAKNVCYTSKYCLGLKVIVFFSLLKLKRVIFLMQTSEIPITNIPELVAADIRKENSVEEIWEETMCCAHMNEQQHMTYPQLLWILFFWVARRYLQPKLTALWLIHDGGRGWIKYSYCTHKHRPNVNFIFWAKPVSFVSLTKENVNTQNYSIKPE